MRQNADLTGTPVEHMSGDTVVHPFRRLYAGEFILNVGISAFMAPASSLKELVT